MKLRSLLAAMFLAATLFAFNSTPAGAQGLWPGLPSASFPLTGDETVPADTNLSAGQYPQTQRITVDQLSGFVRAATALTDGTTVSVNASASNFYTLTLGTGTINIRVLETPTNPSNGQILTVALTQGSGGSETIRWGDGNVTGTFSFGCLNNAVVPCTATNPTLSTTAGAVDVFTFIYNGSRWLNVGQRFNI